MVDDKIQAPGRPIETDRKAEDDLARFLRQAQKEHVARRPAPSGEKTLGDQVVSYVEKDSQGIKSLITTDGRSFERTNGVYTVTVPGLKEPVTVRELTVSGDIISYKIGNFQATESTGGQRSVVPLDKADMPETAKTPASAARADIANRLFDGNFVAGKIDATRPDTDYAGLFGHDRVLAMANRYLKSAADSKKTMADMREEAGRAGEGSLVSSVAPTVFHRCAVIEAVKSYEAAVASGNSKDQQAALTELAKLRLLKLGSESEHRDVHQAIDSYLKAVRDKAPEARTRDMVGASQLAAFAEAKRGFTGSAQALTAFATAKDHSGRMAAYEAFKNAAEAYPGQNILQHSARLGDFVGALHLKETLENPKSDKASLKESLDVIAKTSPALRETMLQLMLESLKKDPANKGAYDGVGKLTIEDLKKRIDAGEMSTLVPHLKKVLEDAAFKETFSALDAMRTTNHSAADLLRVPPSPVEALDAALEKAEDEIAKSNKEFQALERAFLARDTTPERRQELLKDLSEFLKQHDVTIGDSSLLGITDKHQTLNALMSAREQKDPQKVAEYLSKVQQLANSGNEYAAQMLKAVIPAESTPAAVIEKLVRGGTEGSAELQKLQTSFKGLDEELDRNRIKNLAYGFQTDKLPSTKELAEFKALLTEEKNKGNKSTQDWHDWASAATVLRELPIGSNKDQVGRLQSIKELGDMAKSGNQHARNMLLGIMVADVDRNSYQRFIADQNVGDGPKFVRPELPTGVPAYRQQLADAATKAFGEVLQGKTDKLDQQTAFALSVVLGQEKNSANRAEIDQLLKQGLQGANGGAICIGIFDALNGNAPGGPHIANALLHGANRPEFAERFNKSIVHWAERGDEAGLVVAAGLLAGRRATADLNETSAAAILRAAEKKELQPAVVNALLAAYQRDIGPADRANSKANYLLLETLGDALGKTDKTNLSPEQTAEVKKLFRAELKWFDQQNGKLTPEQEKHYEHLMRGYIAMARHFDSEDIKALPYEIKPAMAAALKDKNWQLPPDLQYLFKKKIFRNLSAGGASSALALDCLASMGKVLDKHDIARATSLAKERTEPAVQEAFAKSMMRIIGNTQAKPELKKAAIDALEHSAWFNSSKLDNDVRRALSEYVQGRVSDVRTLDKVLNLVGDCGVQPPLVLVASRMGMPLTDELIRDVEAAERSFGGDRQAVLKVLERAMTVNALPPSLGAAFGRIDLPELVKRMADAPLATDQQFGFLTTDRVEKFIQNAENMTLDKLIAKANEAGAQNITRAQMSDAILGRGSYTSAYDNATGSSQKAYEESIASLQQITRDGHQTSYWWLAAGGAGYLVERFRPGGTEDKFADKQKDALATWQQARKDLGQAMSERETMSTLFKDLKTAKDVGKYVGLVADGKIAESDELALKLLRDQGAAKLRAASPELHDNLLRSDRGKVGEIWQRLNRMHATDMPLPPELRSSHEALKFLKTLNDRHGEGGDKYHLLGRVTHDAALGEAFRMVDSDERMQKAYETFGKLTGLSTTTQSMFREGMAGYKGPEYTAQARRLAHEIEETLKELKTQAPQMRELLKELRETRDTATDEAAKKGLDARIKSLEDMLIGYVPTASGETNSKRYNELKEMCRVIKSSDFDPETFGKWLKDNTGTMILMTTALAGIAAMPFSGGTSGILTVVAVAALTATLGYAANEAWKEARYQVDGTAYGSEMFGFLKEATGLGNRQMNLRYNVEKQQFEGPPELQEVVNHALKEIGKETAVNLIGGGFAKFLGGGLRLLNNPLTKVAAEDALASSGKVVAAMEKAAAESAITRSWGNRFVRAWVEQVPWAAVGGSGEAVIQDQLKNLKDEAGYVEFMGHAASTCFAVLAHRVHGHIMQPKIMPNGALEIPADRDTYVKAIREKYAELGKTPPEMSIEGNVVKYKVGEKTFEMRFVNPEEVAAELNKQGVKPAPPVEGEGKKPVEGEVKIPAKVEDPAKLAPGQADAAVTPERAAALKTRAELERAIENPGGDNFSCLTPEQKQALKAIVDTELAKKGTPEQEAAITKKMQGLLESLKDPLLIKSLERLGSPETYGHDFINRALDAAKKGDYLGIEILTKAEAIYANDPAVKAARAELEAVRNASWTPIDKILSAAKEAIEKPGTGLDALVKTLERARLKPEDVEAIREFVRKNPAFAENLKSQADLLSALENGQKNDTGARGLTSLAEERSRLEADIRSNIERLEKTGLKIPQELLAEPFDSKKAADFLKQNIPTDMETVRQSIAKDLVVLQKATEKIAEILGKNPDRSTLESSLKGELAGREKNQLEATNRLRTNLKQLEEMGIAVPKELLGEPIDGEKATKFLKNLSHDYQTEVEITIRTKLEQLKAMGEKVPEGLLTGPFDEAETREFVNKEMSGTKKEELDSLLKKRESAMIKEELERQFQQKSLASAIFAPGAIPPENISKFADSARELFKAASDSGTSAEVVKEKYAQFVKAAEAAGVLDQKGKAATRDLKDALKTYAEEVTNGRADVKEAAMKLAHAKEIALKKVIDQMLFPPGFEPYIAKGSIAVATWEAPQKDGVTRPFKVEAFKDENGKYPEASAIDNPVTVVTADGRTVEVPGTAVPRLAADGRGVEFRVPGVPPLPDQIIRPATEAGSFSNPVVKDTAKWKAPTQPGGERPVIEIKTNRNEHGSFPEGDPIEKPLVVQLFSNEGVRSEVVIPANARPRLSDDGHGVVFRVPGKPKGANGEAPTGDSYIRLAEPKDARPEMEQKGGVNYRNGYVRVTQEVLVELDGAQKPLQYKGKNVEVNMVMNEKGEMQPVLRMGTTSTARPVPEWVSASDNGADRVVIVAHLVMEMQGLTPPKLTQAQAAKQKELQAIVDRSKAAFGFWQNKTHFHIVPDGFSQPK